MPEFIGFMIVGLIGYVIGGVVGLSIDSAWNPICWYGLFIAWALALGVCLCGFDFD